jgi:hypothetical protein
VLQAGRTTSVAQAEVWALGEGEPVHCGTVLATGRAYRLPDAAAAA